MNEEIKLLTKVCYMYYYEDKVQTDIANRLGLARQTVSRLIQKARDEGIVQIKIQSPVVQVVELETRLEDKFKLKDAIVIQKDYISQEQLIQKLGIAAGEYFLKTIMPKRKIGIGFGKILEVMGEFINSHYHDAAISDVDLVQLVGDIPSTEASDNSQFIISLIARRLHAAMHLLQVPFYIEDPQIGNYFKNSFLTSAVLENYSSLDYAFVEIKSADRIYETVTKKTEKKGISYLHYLGVNYLTNIDAAGEICLNYFNDRGHFVDTVLNECFFGITSKQLSKVRNVVGIVGGECKEAALGSLKTGILNTIITDEDTAKYVLGI
ncbi:sugar-binding transcriptional regulator [Candidatus Formimonas warabiya]|uniref:Sugar-binding domain-containing protein n=1 Tax=Formimonas warabiya TaxID=1761012 RepID=A0A3G1KSZ4_FORW1|nr:sugar-binding domain-containing protein [Candidatus Formimonas warabiya]ATW25602.1 hypothetical protein DCMF_13290 [Candidatus Formimonas warabiya]